MSQDLGSLKTAVAPGRALAPERMNPTKVRRPAFLLNPPFSYTTDVANNPWMEELSAEQKTHNTACSKVRAFVEHPRAWMVKMGYTCVRYRGLTRNALDFALMSIAYNFKRSFHLLGQPLTPARFQ